MCMLEGGMEGLYCEGLYVCMFEGWRDGEIVCVMDGGMEGLYVCMFEGGMEGLYCEGVCVSVRAMLFEDVC